MPNGSVRNSILSLKKTIKDLQSYSLAGNIRELENAIERAVITSPEGELRVELLSHVHGAGPQSPASETLDEIDRAHMLKILEDCYWVIEGPRGAARRLGSRRAPCDTSQKTGHQKT